MTRDKQAGGSDGDRKCRQCTGKRLSLSGADATPTPCRAPRCSYKAFSPKKGLVFAVKGASMPPPTPKFPVDTPGPPHFSKTTIMGGGRGRECLWGIWDGEAPFTAENEPPFRRKRLLPPSRLFPQFRVCRRRVVAATPPPPRAKGPCRVSRVVWTRFSKTLSRFRGCSCYPCLSAPRHRIRNR